jgi:hypothetical protein
MKLTQIQMRPMELRSVSVALENLIQLLWPHLRKAKPSKQAKKPVESWAMGIAAGGRLVQQIHGDMTLSTLRTKRPFATTLVSVQMLNAMAYEALTGMLCPPTPITPKKKKYVDSGTPWFDTYRSHVQSAHSGLAFKEIESISELDSQENIDASTSVAASQRVACTVCREIAIQVLGNWAKKLDVPQRADLTDSRISFNDVWWAGRYAVAQDVISVR